MSKSTTFFLVLPKERVANLLQRKRSEYNVAVVSQSEITCSRTGTKITLTDYAIREKVYAGETMGWVQGILGTSCVVEGNDSDWLNWAKADVLSIDKDYFV